MKTIILNPCHWALFALFAVATVLLFGEAGGGVMAWAACKVAGLVAAFGFAALYMHWDARGRLPLLHNLAEEE